MSTPTWISNLSDPVLKADFTAYANAGKITEAEMATALQGLQAEIAHAHTTVSASQFADLKSIAQNIGSLGASPYLQFIANAFVSNNPANAHYRGGATEPQALGELKPGYSAQNLSELIGKWFLGTDLPSSSFSDDNTGVQTTFSYQTVNAPLYSAGGPSISDVNQGVLGDCYFLASLGEVAQQDPSAIASMITDNHNGTYGVRFYVDGAARYVTVDNQLADGGTLFNSGPNYTAPNLWASLVETAYAEVQPQGVITGESFSSGNSFSTIGNGGYQDYALEEITGASAITEFFTAATGWSQDVYNPSLAQVGATTSVTTASALSTLAADLLVGDSLVLDSTTAATDSNGNATLIADHSFSIVGFDAATGDLELRNPWGSKSGQNWDTQFETSLSALRSADGVNLTGDWIAVANNGTATTVSGASAVAAAGLQAMAQVTSFSVTDSVANVEAGMSGLFADSKLSSLTITGTTGGAPLALIGFNVATTLDLSGNSGAASVTGLIPVLPGLDVATGFSFGANPIDIVLLGSGPTTINHAFGTGSGVEDLISFNAAHDLLSINLNGASLEQTFANGGDWLSSSTDLAHGVFLAGVTSLQAATVSNGFATVR